MLEKYGSEKEYEYAGNLFHIATKRDWYHIRLVVCGVLEARTDTLILPETFEGRSIDGWEAGEIRGAQTVRYLEIPASYILLELRNDLFPNLESVRVHPDNKNFSAQGTMICSANGTELFYCMSAGLRPKVTLPSRIHALGERAFWHTTCEEIVFTDSAILCKGKDTFRDSVWWERQGPVVLVGNLFFRLKSKVSTLELPPYVRRFHPQCFEEFAPKHLISPVAPPKEILDSRHFHGLCESLTITSPSAALKPSVLRTWDTLKSVTFSQPHKLYGARDGVLYSNDGKTLVLYPPGRTDETYHIPEGTVKVASLAFAEHDYLQKVYFPDSVLSIGMGAFYECGELEEVQLPKHLHTIPDASIFQNRGVFQGCQALKSVTLPDELRYLGSQAFLDSGLESVQFGSQLEEIGEFALYTDYLEEVFLPASLKRVQRGALMGVAYVEAYEGSASGLISAINAAPPDEANTLQNLVWDECQIVVLDRDGNEKDELLIPGSLKRSAAFHLELAWNGDALDYEEYDACFEEIKDKDEKLEMALARCLRSQGEENSLYQSYLRRNAQKVGQRLIEDEDEEGFFKFLRMGYLSESAISKLLKLSGERGMVTISAYLLEAKQRNGKRKSSRFAL